jgi:hypothetical protein
MQTLQNPQKLLYFKAVFVGDLKKTPRITRKFTHLLKNVVNCFSRMLHPW